MNVPGADRACPHGPGSSPDLAGELRALTLLALDRLDPVLVRLRAAMEDGTCPVCAVLATVRSERPELAGRLTAHATALAVALREALTDRGPSAPAEAPPRTVQHIRVDRAPAGGTPC